MSLVPPGKDAARTLCLASTGQAEDPRSCPGITGATPANRKPRGVAALADHLDLLPRRHLYC